MPADRLRVLVAALVALAMVAASALFLDWFLVETTMEDSAMSSVSLRRAHSMSASITFWTSALFAIVVAIQTGARLLTRHVNEWFTGAGYLLGALVFGNALLTGYLFLPEANVFDLAVVDLTGVTVSRTSAPLMLIGGAIAGMVAIYYAALNESFSTAIIEPEIAAKTEPATPVRESEKPTTPASTPTPATRAPTSPPLTTSTATRAPTSPPLTRTTSAARAPTSPPLTTSTATHAPTSPPLTPTSTLTRTPTDPPATRAPTSPPLTRTPTDPPAALTPTTPPLSRTLSPSLSRTSSPSLTPTDPQTTRTPTSPPLSRTLSPSLSRASSPSLTPPATRAPTSPPLTRASSPSLARTSSPLLSRSPTASPFGRAPTSPPDQDRASSRTITPTRASTVPPVNQKQPLPSRTTTPPELRGKVRFAALTLELSRGGLDARREDGKSVLVVWRDVVGAVARRLPSDLHGAPFVDIVSTAGSTLRVLPWTKLSGDVLEGDRSLALLDYVVAHCPNITLDPPTRAFIESRLEAAQLPDVAMLAAHDARLA